MKLLKMIENSDGSATMEIILDKQETNFFIELGINKVLMDSLERFEASLAAKPKKKGGGLKR